jgi:hypothetical protein
VHWFAFLCAFLLAPHARSHNATGTVWLLAAPGALFLYYFFAWLSIGGEPEPGPLVARYEPPEGLSAAAVRFTVTTGSDGRSFAAVIAALAVRGCVRVEPRNGTYKLSRLMSGRAEEAKLFSEERRVLSMLFEDGPEIELTPAMDERNNAQNGRFVWAIQQELRQQLGGKYFARHTGWILPGVLATFVVALVLAATVPARGTVGVLFFTVWILFCGLSLGWMIEVSLASSLINATRAQGGWRLLPGLAAISVFLTVIGYMLKQMATGVSPWFALMTVGFLLVNLGWWPWLKSTTAEGRRVLDHIAGFKLFLQKVEQDRLDRLNPADAMPEALEQYLAYAIALEVKEAWGDHLAQTFLIATTTIR